MIKLIIKIALLLILTSGICYSTFFLKPRFKNDYLASLQPKLEKLNKIKTNKIVIIGGSSAAIGINSEMVENNLEVPTVNMALHGALGAKFYLEYVKDDLMEGDVLILSPEYGVLDKKGWYGMNGEAVPKAILFTPSKLPILLNDYTLFKKTVTGIFRSIKAYWKEHPFEKSKYNVKPLYDLRSFDEDNIREVYLNTKLKKQYNHKIDPQFDKNDTPWEELMEYKEYFSKRNIKFYLTLPSILDESIKTVKAKTFFKTLSKETTIPILNNNYDSFFKRPLFNDTNYHLNGIGIKKRTNILIEDINKELYNGAKDYKDKTVFLSQNEFQEIRLNDMTDLHNVKTIINGESMLVTPTKNNKMGSVKYKTEYVDYIGSLFKITVKCSPKTLDNLKFSGLKKYDFDYVKELNASTYVLCKNLSNAIVHPKDCSNTSIGIGYSEGGLSKQDNFTILKAQIIKGDLKCDDVLEYNSIDEYAIKDGTPIIFKVRSFENQNFKINEVSNINSDITLENNKKYLLKFKEEGVLVYDFYNGNIILEDMSYALPIKFKNRKKFEIEISQ